MFIRARVGVSSSSFRFALVHSGAYMRRRVDFGFVWVHSVCVGVAGFIQVRLGSLGRAYASSGSFGVAWVHYCAVRRPMVHSGSRGITRARQVVAVFILMRVCSFGRA